MSCKICTEYAENLRLYHKARGNWFFQAGERKAKNGEPPKFACDACAGLCNPGSDYRTYSKDVGHAERFLLCSPCHYPELDLPLLDKNGNEKDEKRYFKITSQKCFESRHNPPAIAGIGDPDDHGCGYRWRFDGFSVFEVPSKLEGGLVPVRACPIEATADRFVWNEFQNVSRKDNTNEDENDSFTPEWLPVHGTRADFLYRLRQMEKAFLTHKYGPAALYFALSFLAYLLVRYMGTAGIQFVSTAKW